MLAPTGCLVGDSLVMTDRGLVRLRSLGNPDGEQVAGPGPPASAPTTGRARRRSSSSTAPSRSVTVKTARGYRIQGTTMHRIKVVDANGDWQWRRFADVRAGDRVPLMLGGMIGEPREVPLPPLAEAYWTSDHTHVRAALHERGPGRARRLLHGRRLAPCQGPSLLRRPQATPTSSTDWSTSDAGSSAWRPRSRARAGLHRGRVPLRPPDAVVGGVRLRQARADDRASRQGLRGPHPGRRPVQQRPGGLPRLRARPLRGRRQHEPRLRVLVDRLRAVQPRRPVAAAGARLRDHAQDRCSPAAATSATTPSMSCGC